MKVGYLAVNQYGDKLTLKGTKHARKQLLEKTYAKKADKIYIDGPNGSEHVGYVIGQNWWTLYEVHTFQGK